MSIEVSSKFCLTTDMWHSIVDEGYLSLTAHYIDDDWKLHNKIIAFCHVPPPHNANMIHERLIALIKEWKLQQKVFSITLDNAKYNDNMQKLLANSLNRPKFRPIDLFSRSTHEVLTSLALYLTVGPEINVVL